MFSRQILIMKNISKIVLILLLFTILVSGCVETPEAKKESCPYECCNGIIGYYDKVCAVGTECVNNKCVEPGAVAEPEAEASVEAGPEAEVPRELNLAVGETAKTSKIEVTVISAQKKNSYDYYSDIFKETITQEAGPEKTYILVEAEIKNVGSDRVFVGTTDFSVTDSEGYHYDPDWLYYGDNGLDMIKELYQNQKIRGKILFEVPEDASDLEILYDFGNLFIGTELASWEIE